MKLASSFLCVATALLTLTQLPKTALARPKNFIGLFDLFFENPAALFEDGGILGIFGQVVELVGIHFEIVELFFGARQATLFSPSFAP
jgi:hypothetical protein